MAGTHTRAVVLDADGRELARAVGPAALADPMDPRRPRNQLRRRFESATVAANGTLPCRALWAGIAGAGRETVRASIEIALERLGLAEVVSVGSDVEAAFSDAFDTGPGILLVAGTGSIAWGRNEAGARGVWVGGAAFG